LQLKKPDHCENKDYDDDDTTSSSSNNNNNKFISSCASQQVNNTEDLQVTQNIKK
jgi:hypothetical protein